ncbi:hypothetical protein D3C81_2044170 [compost metagenome]
MTMARRVLLTCTSKVAINVEMTSATRPLTEITSCELMPVALVICASDTSTSRATANRKG